MSSPAEEAHENAEHAEHAREPFDKKVAGTMAVIAAVLAIVAVGGHVMTTEELLNQQKASDTWSEYQGKSIRRYQSEIASEMLGALHSPKAADYATKQATYVKDSEALQKKAENLEEESKTSGEKAVRLHLGEVFLEIAIVLASLAILTRRPLLWYVSVGGATVGAVIAATSLTIH